jgi:hypothetical protein
MDSQGHASLLLLLAEAIIPLLLLNREAVECVIQDMKLSTQPGIWSPRIGAVAGLADGTFTVWCSTRPCRQKATNRLKQLSDCVTHRVG